MTIKSFEDLKALRDKHKSSIDLREAGSTEGTVRIAVGMATCGIASGARETINAIADEVRRENLDNVTVVQTGCMGYCYAEPIVEVRVPNQEPVLYGKINAHKAREIVHRHIKNGHIIADWVLERNGY
ncbi:MAG: (2Fe-2S) ferredoxin domain-containing protein [Bacillota bacterium]